MLFHYAKKISTMGLLLIALSSCTPPVESLLTCKPLESNMPLIVRLDESLRKNSEEYFVHYQNKSSGWTFESYLFVGKVNGRYSLISAGSSMPKSEEIISKSYYNDLQKAVNESIKHKNNTQITAEDDYCQYISVSGHGSVILTGENSDLKLRMLRRKLDALILYRN